MSRDVRASLAGFGGALMCLLFFHGVKVLADGDPAVDTVRRVIPYEGVLELDGEVVTGSFSLRFTLYDEDDAVRWSEEWSIPGDSKSQVEVYAGRFSVLLGEYADIDSTILRAEELFVGIEVSTCTDPCSVEDWVSLDGRQLLGVAPFALWAAQGSDLEIAGTLTVRNGAVFDETGLSEAVIQVGLLTIDSQAGEGLINLVAGAKIQSDGTGYNYLGDRGASRIRMNDGQLNLHVGGTSGASGTEVNWIDALAVASDGTVTAPTLNATTLLVTSTSKLTGNVGIGTDPSSATLNVSGAIDSTGKLRIGSDYASGGRSAGTGGTTMPDQFEDEVVLCPTSDGRRTVMVGAALLVGGGDLAIEIFCSD